MRGVTTADSAARADGIGWEPHARTSAVPRMRKVDIATPLRLVLRKRDLMFACGSKAERLALSTICPVCPRVWTAPRWQELFSRLQHWSVRPCVRPLDEVHTTAGHNALRGSGPDRKPAVDNAWGQLGCPDRRI